MVDSKDGPGRPEGGQTVPKAPRRRGLPRPAGAASAPPGEKANKPKKAPSPPRPRATSAPKPAAPPKASAPVRRKTSEATETTVVSVPPAPAIAAAPVVAHTPVPQAGALTEEEQIESAKYLPREMPPRPFEEERFLFPESYGVDRVRLLVKDPDWLFAHWDVDPASVASLHASVGERTLALSQLTLRVTDPENGGASVVLLPPGTRSWYVRTDSARRAYRAELGMTLPSGEFRGIAWSNTVLTPRVGPSPQKAERLLTYAEAAAVDPGSAASVGGGEAVEAGPSAGPWSVPPQIAGQAGETGQSTNGSGSGAGSAPSAAALRGGASDLFRR